MQRSLPWILALVITAAVMLAVGVNWGRRQRDPLEPQPTRVVAATLDEEIATPDSELQSRITQLENEQRILERQLAEQRQLIRPDAMTEQGQTMDEMLALFPAPFPEGDWTPEEAAFEDCWFEAVDGIRLHGWYLRHDQPRALLLHVHGNAGNITHRAGMAAYLRERFSVSVFLFDYRGYGRREGVPTIEGIVRDARAARDYLALREQVAPESIVLQGVSLGGAVAVQVAAEDGARGLILESTFTSLRDAASSLYPAMLVNMLVADRLDSASAIANYEGPLLQCHGQADSVIPFDLGEELFAAANEPKTFIAMFGLDHNDWPSEEYFQAVETFLAELP